MFSIKNIKDVSNHLCDKYNIDIVKINGQSLKNFMKNQQFKCKRTNDKIIKCKIIGNTDDKYYRVQFFDKESMSKEISFDTFFLVNKETFDEFILKELSFYKFSKNNNILRENLNKSFRINDNKYKQFIIINIERDKIFLQNNINEKIHMLSPEEFIEYNKDLLK